MTAADIAFDVGITARPDHSGRHMIAISGNVLILPREKAERMLEEHGFVRPPPVTTPELIR
ncbi:hypothetical protein ACIA74_42550 [Streptomyces sp. NPDC051658]|uniref:hypothetical protein n=1 Tax=Streptomyces sp. NPDC051658 TaxID=3365667 RepID=UPI0037A20D0E